MLLGVCEAMVRRRVRCASARKTGAMGDAAFANLDMILSHIARRHKSTGNEAHE